MCHKIHFVYPESWLFQLNYMRKSYPIYCRLSGTGRVSVVWNCWPLADLEIFTQRQNRPRGNECKYASHTIIYLKRRRAVLLQILRGALWILYIVVIFVVSTNLLIINWISSRDINTFICELNTDLYGNKFPHSVS